MPHPADTPERGEIYWVDLSDSRGSEQRGERPALVISPSLVNEKFNTVVVAAISTSVRSRTNPIAPFLPAGQPLPEDSCVMAWQIRTLDNSRLRDYAGSLNAQQLARVNTALRGVFGLRAPTPPPSG